MSKGRDMNFGSIRRLMVMGGGATYLEFIRMGLSRGFEVIAVTSERHAKEACKERPLSFHLDSYGVKTFVVEDIFNEEIVNSISVNTLGVSFGAAWIFKNKFINLFDGRFLNYHASPLPRNRGAGGFSWRIMSGNRAGALCFHQMSDGVDAGDVLKIQPFIYPEYCVLPSDYHSYTYCLSLDFMKCFLDDLENRTTFTLSEQDTHASTYFPRLNTDAHGWIDWSWGFEEILRFIHAFGDPYSGASTLYKGRRVKLRDCSDANDGEEFHPFMSGLIYRVCDRVAFIATKGGGVRVGMMVDEYGNNTVDRVVLGERLHTPLEQLQNARNFRAIYTPKGLKLSSGLGL